MAARFVFISRIGLAAWAISSRLSQGAGMGLVRLKYSFLFFSFLLLCVDLGCGGGTQGGPPSGGPLPQNPIPTLTGVNPNTTAVGGISLEITALGSGFVNGSIVEWNGVSLNTTYVSSTSLTAQVPASDFATAGTATVTVQNPTPGGGASRAVDFTIQTISTSLSVLDVEGTDVAWNAGQQKLYVAVPGSAATDSATITVVDPVAASIVTSQPLSSAPSGLAISDNGQYLYAVINQGAAIQRLILPTLAPDIQWTLGTDPMSGSPNLAGDIKVQPGVAHTLAVSLGQFGSGSVAVFDDSIERSNVAGTIGSGVGNSLQWKADGSELYAAYTTGNDSSFFTTVSDDALYKMPVTSSGAGPVTTYDSSFREEGTHLQFDPGTGYVYGDWGEVVNTGDGVPVGNYRYSRPFSTFFPGPLSVVDPSLKRFYTLLEVREPDGSLAFQIQSFDQNQFQLLSTIVIPNVIGQPANFIRWGQAGLAVVTNDISGAGVGKLYVLDGAFVNPLVASDTSAGSLLTPVPTLTDITPLTATVGGGALTINVTGHDFVGQPTVYWNGNALPTTLVSSTQVSAQVPAAALVSVTQATITASNTTNPSLVSNALPFSVNSAPPSGSQLAVYSTGGDDLVWDSNFGKIYVAMPGIQGESGDSIAIVDPVTGTVSNTGFLGSDPARLSFASNGQYLYAALYGQNAIQQLMLPNFTVNTSWTLGGAGNFLGPYYALDLQAAPGAPQTTAVVLANFDVSPSPASVTIYDGATPRVTQLQASAFPYSSLQWAGNQTTLYAVDQEIPQDFLVLGVLGSGATLNQHYSGVLNAFSPEIHYDAGTGLVYTDGGDVIQPLNGTLVGSYGASGAVVPDSTLGRVFILGQTGSQSGTSNYTIESFDQTSFTAIGAITIDNVVGTPTAFIRWGVDGLAFTTQIGAPADFLGTGPGQLYVISGIFVNPAGSATQSTAGVQLAPVNRTWNLRPAIKSSSDPTVKLKPMAR